MFSLLHDIVHVRWAYIYYAKKHIYNKESHQYRNSISSISLWWQKTFIIKNEKVIDTKMLHYLWIKFESLVLYEVLQYHITYLSHFLQLRFFSDKDNILLVKMACKHFSNLLLFRLLQNTYWCYKYGQRYCKKDKFVFLNGEEEGTSPYTKDLLLP